MEGSALSQLSEEEFSNRAPLVSRPFSFYLKSIGFHKGAARSLEDYRQVDGRLGNTRRRWRGWCRGRYEVCRFGRGAGDMEPLQPLSPADLSVKAIIELSLGDVAPSYTKKYLRRST